MGIFSKFEHRMEDTFEGSAGSMSKAPISPVQIAKKAEKQMHRETMVGAGKQYAPTLYTVLVNADDDTRLFGYYPTLAGETETYLSAKAAQEGLTMDGHPLVRFVVDEGLRHGKFDVIAEMVAAPIVEQLRDEEMQRYGIAPRRGRASAPFDQRPQHQPQAAPAPQAGYQRPQAAPAQQPYPQEADNADIWNNGYGGYAAYVKHEEPAPVPAEPQRKPPLPYVPEEEIDRSIDYGEYTFNSEDFEDYRKKSSDFAEVESTPEHEYAQQSGQVKEPAQTMGIAGGTQQAANSKPFIVRARLVDMGYQRPYDLTGTHVTLGRESHNDIVVQDINASRKHAELVLNAQGIWTIADLGSMNGTLVNGISVASHPLYPGDIVTIGKTDFEFVLA